MGKTKNRVIVLNKDNTYSDTKKKCSQGEFKVGENTKKFHPKAVFVPEKRGRLFHKPNMIIVGEKLEEAYKFAEEELKCKCGEVVKHWDLQTDFTQAESKKIVNKQIAHSLEEQKPMTWTQFILLLIPIVICLVMQLLIVLKLRLF